MLIPVFGKRHAQQGGMLFGQHQVLSLQPALDDEKFRIKFAQKLDVPVSNIFHHGILEALNTFGGRALLVKALGAIHQLTINYDSKGLPAKYLLVYCNVADGSFVELCNKYFHFLQSRMPFQFKPTDIDHRETKYTNINDIQSTHEREGKLVVLNHLLIKMPVK